MRWTRALRSGRVISKASYRIMTTPQGAAAKADPPYGFGVWVIESEGRLYINHLGLIDGDAIGLTDFGQQQAQTHAAFGDAAIIVLVALQLGTGRLGVFLVRRFMLELLGE